MTALTSRTFMKSNQIALPEPDGRTLQTIRDQLWYCYGESRIRIYDGDLVMIRDIKPNIGFIYSFADLDNNVAAASNGGMFLLTYMGRMDMNIFIE